MVTTFYCKCGMRVEFSSDNVNKKCLDNCPYCKGDFWKEYKHYLDDKENQNPDKE